MSGPAAIPPGAVQAAEATLRAYLKPWLTYEVFGTTLSSQIHTAASVALRDAEAVWPHASATDSTPVPAPHPGCCEEDGCRRANPIGIYRDDLTGQVYAVTERCLVKDRGDGTGTSAATERHDITPQMERFLCDNEAWVREVLAGEAQ